MIGVHLPRVQVEADVLAAAVEPFEQPALQPVRIDAQVRSASAGHVHLRQRVGRNRHLQELVAARRGNGRGRANGLADAVAPVEHGVDAESDIEELILELRRRMVI